MTLQHLTSFYRFLFSTALDELVKSIPIQSLILSSRFFFVLLLFSFSFQIPSLIYLNLLSSSMTHRHSEIWIGRGNNSVWSLIEELLPSILPLALSALQWPVQSLCSLSSVSDLATYFRFTFRWFKSGSCQLLAKVWARSTGQPLRRSKPAQEKCG